MAVLGGMGTVFGPVIGAIALLVLEETLPRMIGLGSYLVTGHEVAAAREYWQLILGPMLLLVVLFARGGIDGILAGLRRG
jgi:branched-chain amino acid transport system permease protein